MDCAFELIYNGRRSEKHQIDFYDATQALWGFERTISLTTHLILNGNVITQSPSKKGFLILIPPVEAGSWKTTALLGLGSSIGALGLAPPDTMFGWLAKSAVEYVIEEAAGFRPDFDETLGPQIERYRSSGSDKSLPRDLSSSRFDSVIEKCEDGIRAMHRPIVSSGTASTAQIGWRVGSEEGRADGYLDPTTYDYMSTTLTRDDLESFCGVISSYNTNTFSGRLYVPEENRTIPFQLSDEARNPPQIRMVTISLSDNAENAARRVGVRTIQPDVCFRGFRNESSSGRLKKIFVTVVLDPLI